jgi:hypothetical protein
MKPNLIIPPSGGSRIEPLEQRIAPALAISHVVAAVAGSPLVLHAGDMLSTASIGGAYLMFVEKGDAIVYTTDLNNNFQVDFNEITGIAAGDGLRLISFVDIHGDIVTNLRPDGQRLTDSDNDASTGFDGRVLTNSQIEKIELRSLTAADLPVGEILPDRLALSSYSIFGNIYAGRGFGATDGGLIIDIAGVPLQQAKFDGDTGFSKFVNVPPQIGSIKVGTAASGELFSFGTSPAGSGLGFTGEDIQGALQVFRVPAGQDGSDITGVRIADGVTPYNLGTLQAGDGGFNGRGGNISNILVTGDKAGGYGLIAGNAGDGTVGRQGGSISGFTDLGSITSQVILQSGNGGRGLLGAGGPGGLIDLSTTNPTNIAGRVFVNLGSGGDGLTAGGDGASQKAGSFISPEGDIPFALNVASSTRSIGDIFNTISTVTDENGVVTVLAPDDPRYHAIHSFDFDRDGTNDIVYTNRNPDQVVVVFGFPGGGLDPQGLRYPGALPTLYLNAPSNPEALVVADFNGDGLPDIASAAQDNSFAGVNVYLSKYAKDPQTGLPTTLQGFYDPIYSPLPHVANYADALGNSYYQAAYKITNLVAGDFDGDGIMDLGLSTLQQVIGPGDESAVVFIMRGDSHPVTGPKGTGYFFADFVHSGTPLGLPYSDGFFPQITYNDRVILKASALVDGGRDYLFAMTLDQRDIALFDYVQPGIDPDTSFLVANVPIFINLGRVDTNRDVGADKFSPVDAKGRDFTLFDLDNDGDLDIATLTQTPANFLVVHTGDGTTGGFVISSDDPADGEDNTGIPLSEDTPKGLDLPDTLVGILTTASDDGRGNDVTLVSYNRPGGHIGGFIEVTFTDGNAFTAVAGPSDSPILSRNNLDDTVLAFDTYRPDEATTTTVGYALGHAVTGDEDNDFILVTAGAGGGFVPQANNGFFFSAGDGGDSATGRAGNGGQIGNKLESAGGVITGTLDIQLPRLTAFEPVVRFVAGNGGNGYTGGGDGGDVEGLTLTSLARPLTSAAFLFGGNGGASVKGTGGAGGDLDALSIVTGEVFAGGHGGRGVIGGPGGSVLGNKISGLPDTTNANTADIAVEGGHGGLGLKRGGPGGSIVNFTPDFLSFTGEAPFQLFHYKGGDGGNSLSGPGGNGGSVLNSSPVAEDNNVLADINLVGGRGGNGLTGGKGGTVDTFANAPGQGSLPASVTVLGGFGGFGTTGRGGAGGDVRNINISAKGVGTSWTLDLSQPDKIEIFPGLPNLLSPILFGRYIAGEGAVSFGSVGGAGGSVNTATGIAASASFAVASGKGGDGLRGGANGGDVLGGPTSSIINASAVGNSKVLIIAGEGGDVFGAVASPSDPLAYGGINGTGGNGGSIANIRQDASQSTPVDLIAGNGGSTVNFGSPLDATTKAGKGGSIRNVDIAGNIGSINPNTPILAYNDIFANESVADFVTATLVNGASTALNDALGNVGLVAGATGRVKDFDNDGILDPASVGTNGSVVNVVASNIMSAVAGSVDRIASIQTLDNVRVRFEGAVYGADKAVPDPATPGGRPDYLDEDGNLVTAPVLGGKLLDGAIVAKNDRPLRSIRDFVRR